MADFGIFEEIICIWINAFLPIQQLRSPDLLSFYYHTPSSGGNSRTYCKLWQILKYLKGNLHLNQCISVIQQHRSRNGKFLIKKLAHKFISWWRLAYFTGQLRMQTIRFSFFMKRWSGLLDNILSQVCNYTDTVNLFTIPPNTDKCF